MSGPYQAENAIEVHLTRKAKHLGFLCYKFTSPSQNGVPDRIVIGNGQTVFIELKATGKAPRPLQEHVIHTMRAKGAIVYVADSTQKVDEILDAMLQGQRLADDLS